MTDADQPLAPPLSTAPATDRILVQGLEFETIIGILPQEREIPQPLRIDLVLEVDSFREAAASEQIDRTVDYAAVSRRVTEIAREGRFQLVETLAERTCEALLAEFPIRRITLRAMKPHALAEAAGVGVEITREAAAGEGA
ncbi:MULTISPECIES: dihydroneopterin aldolase [unclassified Guyparkeria]|uniref:dihydroneopterin aldolase n=1 Tax=unclassified Guyparkeria TaxID=2626246 RepID=UPI0018D23F0E|nr:MULTISPECIES: dihydroneopterin aldolase [unclassified Guyparkeria]